MRHAAAVQQWRPSYARATVMQAGLAIVGLLAALGAWALGRGVPVLVAGLLFGAVVPFPLLVIFPTNKQLLAPTLDDASPKAAALLVRWNRLHAVRSGAVALVILLPHLGDSVTCRNDGRPSPREHALQRSTRSRVFPAAPGD